MMLGVLLARAGVDVTVLEKYPDFFRDFRGDTVHPSTLELLYELGWLDEFLALPHDEFQTASANIAGESVKIADLIASYDALQIRRLDAAMGLPELSRGARQTVPDLPSDDEDRRRRPHRRRGARYRRACPNSERRRSRSRQSSSSGPTDATRRFATSRASRWKISARRWTSCGCAFRSIRKTRRSSSAG